MRFQTYIFCSKVSSKCMKCRFRDLNFKMGFQTYIFCSKAHALKMQEMPSQRPKFQNVSRDPLQLCRHYGLPLTKILATPLYDNIEKILLLTFYNVMLSRGEMHKLYWESSLVYKSTKMKWKWVVVIWWDLWPKTFVCMCVMLTYFCYRLNIYETMFQIPRDGLSLHGAPGWLWILWRPTPTISTYNIPHHTYDNAKLCHKSDR